MPGTDLGSAGPKAILILGRPSRCDLFGRLSEKPESMPLLCVVPPQNYIFCCADFGSTSALNGQQKLKPFLHSFKAQMALRSFLGDYSSFVQFRSSLSWISMISSVFCRFVFRIYTFSYGTVLPPSETSSNCRSDYLYVNSFFIVIVTTYFMKQTSTIHSVDTELIYAVLKMTSSKQFKI